MLIFLNTQYITKFYLIGLFSDYLTNDEGD